MATLKKNKHFTKPTNAEIKILLVLWQYGASTVRFVNEKLNEEHKEVNYTSTLKQMQVMAEKGLLARDESNMKHIYSPVDKEEKMKEHFLREFVDSFYKGSTSKMVMQLLGNKKTTKKDIEDIKEQLRRMDG